MIDVYTSNEDGFQTYRIPALLKLHNGTLLAFCEARQFLSDHAQNKIALKRSLDKGKSWGEIQVIADAGMDSLNNPLVVQDDNTSDIVLMYQKYPYTTTSEVDNPDKWKSHSTQSFPANIHEGVVSEGFRGKICRTFIKRSSDNGISWSEAQDITESVKRPIKVTSYAGGPGIGIQLIYGKYKGRIIMPFSQGPWGEMKVYTVYSDDGGKSWQYGDVAPSNNNEQVNEVQMAELIDGRIILNARSYKGEKLRKIAFSEDGGGSWSVLKDAKDLIEPECQGSLISFDENPNVKSLIYCGPSDSEHRRKGMLKQSRDDGENWNNLNVVYSGFFGYSSICQLDQYIGVLFERDDYSKISFKSVPIV